MVLGIIFKKLYPVPLFVLNASISISIILIHLLLPDKSQKSKTLPSSGDVFKEINEKIIRFFFIIKSDRILLSIFLIFFISLGYLIFTGYLFPSYTWDALLYHLPAVGYFLQSGAIQEIPDHSLIYLFINIFPKNIELFFLWNIIFLKSDIFVDLSQLFFTLAGMLSIYSIAVKIKIKERYAVYSSLLFFFAPLVILQSVAEYVDIAVSVLFLISVNFLICGQEERLLSEGSRTSRSRDNVSLFLAGLSAGILLGSKGSGPVFILGLSILFFINEIKRQISFRDKESPAVNRIFLRYILYFMLPVILMGSYWYLKNWLYYGNPVYPFKVTIFNRTLFNGIFTEMLERVPDAIRDLSILNKLLYVWMEKIEYYLYAINIGGFGPIWFILFLPCIVFSVFHAIKNRKYDFLFIGMVIILTFIIHPRNWNPRYVIFIFGLGSLSFGIMLNNYFRKREMILRFLALTLVIYVFFTANSPCITPEKIKEFAGLPAKERTLERMEPCVINDSQQKNYGLWTWIRNNVLEGDTLAHTFHPLLIAPLWNSGFSNKIIYVKSGNFIDWLEKLKVVNTDYILIRQNSPENRWLAGLEKLRRSPGWPNVYDNFKILYSDKEYKVLKFVKTKMNAAAGK